MRIGVFDSGIGGKAIAQTLAADFPEAEIMYAHDGAHMPYGGRHKDEIIQLTETAIAPLLEARCDCIVIACNTATAAALQYLRETYPTQHFIGLEPMVKPAAEATTTGTIAICATPYTLSSERYRALKNEYASGLTVLEPDCSAWALMIEQRDIDEASVEKVVDESLAQGADVIVLACTHYHWIKDLITQRVAGRATILDPSEAISKRVASLLEDAL